METLKTWAISTCAVVIIASITSMIVPNISGKNIMRLIISGFILMGILSSFFNLVKNDLFSLDSVSAFYDDTQIFLDSDYPNEITENIEDYAAQALYPLIKKELNNEGLDGEFGVKVELEQKNEGIELKSVHITTSSLHKNFMDSLKDKLQQKMGVKIYIDVIKPEGN